MKRDAPTAEAFVSYGAVLILHETIEPQTVHAHRPFELIVALDGRFKIRRDTGDIVWAASSLVPPMERHAILGCDGRLARMYIDPGARRVLSWKDYDAATDTGGRRRLVAALDAFLASDRSVDKARDLIALWKDMWIGTIEQAPVCDARVAAALKYLDDQAVPTATRADLAKRVGLSPSRFAAIFAQETGMSLRNYLNWRRVLLASRFIREKDTITGAAVQAGFADGAHLTRSYRKTLGSTPSQLQTIKVGQPTSKRHRTPPFG